MDLMLCVEKRSVISGQSGRGEGEMQRPQTCYGGISLCRVACCCTSVESGWMPCRLMRLSLSGPCRTGTRHALAVCQDLQLLRAEGIEVDPGYPNK